MIAAERRHWQYGPSYPIMAPNRNWLHSATICGTTALSVFLPLANSRLNLSEWRESATGVSSTFHLEEQPPLPKRKAQNILFLEFQQSVNVCYASRSPEQWICSALLFRPMVWLIHASHKQLCAHTHVAHQHYHYYVFVFKRQIFCHRIDRDLFKMTALVAWM